MGYPVAGQRRSQKTLSSEGSLQESTILGKIVREGTGFAQARALDRPARRSSEITKDRKVNQRDERMRRKLLVVDDDPYLTTQLRKLLESEDLSVDTVS